MKLNLSSTCGTTAPGSTCNTRTNCLACFSGCIPTVNLKARESGWPTYGGLSLVMAGERGPRAKSARGRPSISHFPILPRNNPQTTWDQVCRWKDLACRSNQDDATEHFGKLDSLDLEEYLAHGG